YCPFHSLLFPVFLDLETGLSCQRSRLMTLQSMTGFARYSGTHQNGETVTHFTWEVRSVNGKGLDVRLRLPQGFEALEHNIRAMVAKSFTRGNMQVSLNVEQNNEGREVFLNHALVEKL